MYWKCGHRVLRRWVVPTLGRKSRKASRRQPGQPCTLLSLCPKEEKNWAKPARSGPSHRSGEKTYSNSEYSYKTHFLLRLRYNHTVSSPQSVETMKKEIDVGDAGPYRAPSQLRKRSDFSSRGADSDSRVFEANEWVTGTEACFFPSHLPLMSPSTHHCTCCSHLKWWMWFLCVLCCREAMGVVLHKDSKWFQQWKDFKENNVVFNSEKISWFYLHRGCGIGVT